MADDYDCGDDRGQHGNQTGTADHDRHRVDPFPDVIVHVVSPTSRVAAA
ncbi:hypothetical protein [Mycobacterium sp. DL592]|nr:hypothetical protein [Mycobacterium sp. DL592]